MRRVVPNLSLANGLIVSNVWLLVHQGRRVLVDTGHGLERPMLRRQLWRAGVRGRGDLDLVLLTHRHSDHAGNAAWLRRTFGAPVACHELDARELSGRAAPLPMVPGARWPHERLLCLLEDHFPARCDIDETFTDGATMRGFRVFHIPGHTNGSVILHHEATGTLFTGDVIVAGIPPLRLLEYPRLAVRGFSCDVELCHARARAFLEDLPPTEVLCSGHGPPIVGDVEKKLARLRLPVAVSPSETAAGPVHRTRA